MRETKYAYIKVTGNGYELWNNGEMVAIAHNVENALELEKTVNKKCKWVYNM